MLVGRLKHLSKDASGADEEEDDARHSRQQKASSSDAIDVLERDEGADEVGSADDETCRSRVLQAGRLEKGSTEVHQAVETAQLLSDEGHRSQEDGTTCGNIGPDFCDPISERTVLDLNVLLHDANLCFDLLGSRLRIDSSKGSGGFFLSPLLDEVSWGFGHKEVDADNLNQRRESAKGNDPSPAG